MEIAPLQSAKAGYEGAPASYDQYELGRYIDERIRRKSDRYAASKGPGLWLLTYVTDWRFDVTDGVISLVQFWMNRQPSCFDVVHLYVPVMPEGGFVYRLHPTDSRHWAGFDPERFRGLAATNIDPAGWRIR